MRGNCPAQAQTLSASSADPSVGGSTYGTSLLPVPGKPENTSGEEWGQCRRNGSKLIWDEEALSQGQRSGTLPYPRRHPASFTPEAGDRVRTATYALCSHHPLAALQGPPPSGDGKAPAAPSVPSPRRRGAARAATFPIERARPGPPNLQHFLPAPTRCHPPCIQAPWPLRAGTGCHNNGQEFLNIYKA